MSKNLPVGMAVEYFMRAMEQEIPAEPQLPDPDRWEMRKKLIDEERKELYDAYEDGDIPALLDAAVDLVYVAIGAALDAGLTQFDEAFAAVHKANMSKLHPCPECRGREYVHNSERGIGLKVCPTCAGRGQKVLKRDDGKVLKPVGWVAPDIASIIWKETDAGRTTPTAAE